MRYFLQSMANICLLIAIAVPCLQSADPVKKDPAMLPAMLPTMLSAERIFSDKEFDVQDVDLLIWSERSASYFTTVLADGSGKDESNKKYDVVRVDVASGKKELVIPAALLMPAGETKQLPIDGMTFSRDETKLLIYTNSQRVWRKKTRGDYWVLNLATKELKKLGGEAKPSTLQFAKFSSDGSRVAYVRENNIYAQNTSDLRITSLTTDGTAKIVNGTGDWVNEEELAIVDAFRWSPDGQSIAFWQFDTTGVPEFHLLDNTAGLYPRVTTFAYPKVGQVNSAVRLGVVNATGGEVRWLAIPGDPRQHFVAEMGWTADSKAILLQQLNRRQNTNLVMLADAKTGATQTIMTEKDAAWLESENPVSWVKGGQAFMWLSERDGWRHAYVVSSDGKKTTLITPGDFDVLEIEGVDEANDWVYFSASPENPTQRYLFRVHLNGTGMERVTPTTQPGWHVYRMSPDMKSAEHTYSTFTTPPVTDLITLSNHSVVRVLADNAALVKKMATLKLPKADFFRVDIGNGVIFDGWRITPPDMLPGRKYPVIFYEYGEPAGQTVMDAWQKSLYHWMLAQQGFVVASIDTSGTKVPRGRTWRKSVLHQIGVLAPQELATAVTILMKKWDYADPTRVGVWGWSGGGSNTLHAIFRFPEVFHTAVAVAPNADQLLYDSIYQERYMGLLGENAEGYRVGSPITYAEQLRGNLLLIHGTGDDNGHFQGTEKLMNTLIGLNKRFSMLAYPARSHSLKEGKNTQTHLYTVMSEYFMTHLQAQVLNGQAPAAPVR